MHGGDSFGMVSHERHGLPCRALPNCAFVSQVIDDLAITLSEAAARRDAHELSAHQYTHVQLSTVNYPFAARMSRRGRSTLRRTQGDDAA